MWKCFVTASHSTLKLQIFSIYFQMLTRLQIWRIIKCSHALDVTISLSINRPLSICVGFCIILLLLAVFFFIVTCHMLFLEVQLHDLRCGSQLSSCELPFVLTIYLLSTVFFICIYRKDRIQTFSHLPHFLFLRHKLGWSQLHWFLQNDWWLGTRGFSQRTFYSHLCISSHLHVCKLLFISLETNFHIGHFKPVSAINKQSVSLNGSMLHSFYLFFCK